MKIFVSSTVKDLGDLRDELYRRLKELGHTAWFSEKEDFPIHRHPDSMTNCLMVAEECDLFVVLLDKRAGLPYTEREGSPYPDLFGLTISEAEYRCARKKGKPVCIFVRNRVEHESAIYRQVKDKGQRESMRWYSDQAVYEFYDRLMHEKPHIPWRYTFDSLGEIIGPLNAIIGKVQSSYTLPVPPTPYIAHPYPMQRNFTGRVAERTMLTEWFANDPCPVCAYIAIGGMGKSALTWHWLHEDVLKKESKSPEGIIWWSFYDKEAGFERFLDHAIAYTSSGTTNPKGIPSSRDRMDALYTLLSQHHFLLVFDGVERVLRAYAGMGSPYQGDAVKEDERGDYRSCIDPNCGMFLQWLGTNRPRAKTLLTSRLFPRELDELEGCLRRDLDKMDKGDAVEFFRRQGVTGTRAEIEEVCEAYGYHPLSLRLLSGMIVHDMKYNGDIKAWTRHNPLPKLIPKEHNILELAYNSLDKKKQAFISKLAAFRNPMDYNALAIFNEFGSEEKFNEVLLELVDRGMLFRDEKHNKFDLHPIVRKYCYDRLTRKEKVHSQLIDYFAALPTPEKVESLDDLAPVIELYHHTVRAGKYDEAYSLFYDRLNVPLYYRLGLYQTFVELQRAFFKNGDYQKPLIQDKSKIARLYNDSANSYAILGQSRQAIPLFEMTIKLREKAGNKKNLAIGLVNLATQQFLIGELDAAESTLRRSIETCREIKDDFRESRGHQELSRVLTYRGKFEEFEQESSAATKLLDESAIHQRGTIFAYRSLRSLIMSNADEAMKAATKARELADIRKFEADIIRAEYLLGAAYLMNGNLPEAEQHLTEALTRDRKINLVELEPDILPEFAKLRFKEDRKKEALEKAEEALQIADRCEYRLKQADIHNFFAEFYLESKDTGKAKEHAETAKERAECGYKPAREKAAKLLKEMERKAK